MRKFVRRHRAGVAAAALVALSLVGGVIATTREARIAQAERARAEHRFADVRRLANVVLFDVSAALENVSGAMAARRLLVDNAVRYLDDLAREAGDEPALLTELAAAYERVGEMQGMPEWQSEGRSGDALASCERALELRRRARALAGDSLAATLAEARVLTRIGSVLAARGRTADALARHREALALLEQSMAGAGPSPTAATGLALAQTLVAVGDDTWELGDVPAAAIFYDRALVAARSAVAAESTSAEAIRQVGVVEQRLGDAAADAGDWPRAVEFQAASLAVDRDLAQRLPDDIEIRRDLGTDLSRLGVLQAKRGDAAGALDSHREATQLRAALLAKDPRDARARDDLAESRYEGAKALATLGRLVAAAGEFDAVAAERRLLIAHDPHNVRWEDALANVLVSRADLEVRRGDPRSAAAALAEALAIRRRLAAESPDFASNRILLAELEKRHHDGI